MGKKQFHTRLDDDTAEWVDEYREERDITQAEALRRLVRAGQEEYRRDDRDDDSDDESDDEQAELIGDGGEVIRPALSDMVAVYSFLTIVPSLLYTLRMLNIVDSATFSLPQLYTLSLSGFFLFAVCLGLLYTRVPERVDRALYARGRTARRLLTPGSS